jgi:adenylylsulfate reductase subunit B
MPPVIDNNLCNFCGICYNVCPQDVFAIEKQSRRVPEIAYPQECWYCGACVVDCPRAAVSLDLPLPLHIVPSPALYGPPGPEEAEALIRAADFSRSIERDPGGADQRVGKSVGGGKSDEHSASFSGDTEAVR